MIAKHLDEEIFLPSPLWTDSEQTNKQTDLFSEWFRSSFDREKESSNHNATRRKKFREQAAYNESNRCAILTSDAFLYAVELTIKAFPLSKFIIFDACT